MNFPTGSPIWDFLYWLVNTPGLGGIAVSIIVVGCLGSFAAALRWIIGGAAGDQAVYAYPTSALHLHSEPKKEEK